MRIAVPYMDGQIFQHFGHTECFKLYSVQDGQVIAPILLETNGSGHGALAQLLQDQGVDTLICGGIGGGALQALAQAGIQVYPGVSGDADQAVEDLLHGGLRYDPHAQCAHHGQDSQAGCGNHGCGHGHCGSH